MTVSPLKFTTSYQTVLQLCFKGSLHKWRHDSALRDLVNDLLECFLAWCRTAEWSTIFQSCRYIYPPFYLTSWNTGYNSSSWHSQHQWKPNNSDGTFGCFYLPREPGKSQTLLVLTDLLSLLRAWKKPDLIKRVKRTTSQLVLYVLEAWRHNTDLYIDIVTVVIGTLGHWLLHLCSNYFDLIPLTCIKSELMITCLLDQAASAIIAASHMTFKARVNSSWNSTRPLFLSHWSYFCMHFVLIMPLQNLKNVMFFVLNY